MRLFALLYLSLLYVPLLGQTLIKEGKLFYDITYQNLPPEMKRNEHLLPHEASFYFKNQRTRMEMGLAGMGKNTTIYDGNTRETIVLLNIFFANNPSSQIGYLNLKPKSVFCL